MKMTKMFLLIAVALACVFLCGCGARIRECENCKKTRICYEYKVLFVNMWLCSTCAEKFSLAKQK